jgi:hypothetical protein
MLAIALLFLLLPCLVVGQAKENKEKAIAIVDEPIFDIDFSLDCTSPPYRIFCDKIKSMSAAPNTSDQEKLWEYWPGGGKRVSLLLKISFFVDPKDAELFLNGEGRQGDLWFSVRPTSADNSLEFRRDNGEVRLSASHAKAQDFGSNGKLKSIPDMQGVTAIALEYTRDVGVRSPRMLSGTWSKVVASEQDWSISHRMTCDGPARNCVTPAGASLSRFNSCWVTHRCRPRSVTLAASRTSEAP